MSLVLTFQTVSSRRPLSSSNRPSSTFEALRYTTLVSYSLKLIAAKLFALTDFFCYMKDIRVNLNSIWMLIEEMILRSLLFASDAFQMCF
jgi:hypothetical protein